MKANYYRVTETATIETIDGSVFNSTYQDKNTMHMVSVVEAEPSEVEYFLADIGVDETAIYCVLNPRNVSVVFPFDNAVYFEFSVCVNSDDNEPREHYVSFLCLENLVICINAASVMTPQYLLTVTNQLKLAQGSMPSLLSALLARESLLVSKMAIELRSELYRMDERMDKDPESIEIADIHDHKKLLRVYDTVSSSQIICFDMLRSLDDNLLELIEYPMYFQLASTNASNTSQVLLRLDKTITDLSLRYDTNEQEKMNHRLGVLTILSAIFMPITFLAGIFGMNFDNMPELHFAWGYPVALMVMAGVALGLYFYFKKDGWLD